MSHVSELPKDLVLKNLNCSQYDGGKSLKVDLINRGERQFVGNVRLRVIDSDGDTAWQGTQALSGLGLPQFNTPPQIKVDAKNGVQLTYFLSAGSCSSSKLKFTLD